MSDVASLVFRLSRPRLRTKRRGLERDQMMTRSGPDRDQIGEPFGSPRDPMGGVPDPPWEGNPWEPKGSHGRGPLGPHHWQPFGDPRTNLEVFGDEVTFQESPKS